MPEYFYIKQNDRRPALRAILKLKNSVYVAEVLAPGGSSGDGTGTALDLSDASVDFIMYDLVTGTEKVNADATIVTATSGLVQYSWAAGDTDTVGTYYGEFEITYADSTTLTCPNDEHIVVKVTAELG